MAAARQPARGTVSLYFVPALFLFVFLAFLHSKAAVKPKRTGTRTGQSSVDRQTAPLGQYVQRTMRKRSELGTALRICFAHHLALVSRQTQPGVKHALSSRYHNRAT